MRKAGMQSQRAADGKSAKTAEKATKFAGK
jgi:hypothetical protein